MLVTDSECNGWEVGRARDVIKAGAKGAGLGSWDLLINCLDTGGRTDDEGRALFKIC
jgi:hypothetical protein